MNFPNFALSAFSGHFSTQQRHKVQSVPLALDSLTSSSGFLDFKWQHLIQTPHLVHLPTSFSTCTKLYLLTQENNGDAGHMYLHQNRTTKNEVIMNKETATRLGIDGIMFAEGPIPNNIIIMSGKRKNSAGTGQIGQLGSRGIVKGKF